MAVILVETGLRGRFDVKIPLVRESPSLPFSLERGQREEKVEDLKIFEGEVAAAISAHSVEAAFARRPVRLGGDLRRLNA